MRNLLKLLVSLNVYQVLLVVLSLNLAYVNVAIANDEVNKHISAIRSIEAISDDKLLKQFNQQLDAAWTYFKANKKVSLPILQIQLERELKEQLPNDFFLLDIGYLLYLHGNDTQKTLAKKALYSLDASQKIIHFNIKQLFDFTYKVSADRDPEILDFINRTFLINQEQPIFVPMHAMRLDPTLMCVFLYGIYGEGAEEALVEQLVQTSQQNRIIEILGWIGSESSILAVEKVMYQEKSYDTLARSVRFFMTVAGSKGNQVMTSFNPKGFNDKSKEYYQKVMPAIKNVTFDSIYQQLKSFPGDKNLSERKLTERLDLMFENHGKDQQTSPIAILNSDIAKEKLVKRLIEIRSRMFYRLSDEALSDVKITNAVINALYYRQN